MKKFTTLLLAILMVLPAIAATIPAGTKLYLTPNKNWNESNARFAAYFFGNGEAWVSMTKVEGESNLYELTSPNKNYSNVIFCRMNPSTTTNSWGNKWNQTMDLTYDGNNNHYTVKENTWDKGGGTWSYYGTSVEVMVGLSIAPEKFFEGDEVTFSANVVNIEGEYTTTFYVDDAAIEGNTWTATAGNHTAYVEVAHSAGVSTSDKESFKVEAVTSSFDVYLDKSTAYNTTYIYSWDANGANPCGSWPGTQMTQIEVVNDVEYLKYTFRNVNKVSIIFTDNAGNQTKNIEDVSKDTYYQLNSKTGNSIDVTIVNPGEVVEPETPSTLVYNVTVPAGTPLCYIVGAFNSWDVANAPLMTKVDDTHYTITLDNVTKASEYKYTCGQSWDYVELKADRTDVANRTWSESDVVEAWLDMPTSTPDVIESLTYNVTVPAGTPACYIIGAYNGWSPAIATAMTKIDDTHYTVTLDEVSKSMEYKYICGQSWDYVELRADRTDVANRTWSENDVVEAWANIPNENPETPGTLTYNVTVPAGTPACYIVGAFNGWDVANASQMTMVDETHYTITLENVTKSMEYKYVCAQDWVYVESRGENRKWSENDVVSAWVSLPNIPEEPELETLIYNVTVPYGTEACYIAGEMNGWTFTAMERVDENHFNITIDNVSKSMRYKYACGEDWEYVEMQADGVTDVVDRTWNQYDTVEAWKNVWSGIADITANGINVYGTYNAICVSTTQEVTLYIYNMQGMLVETYTANGNATIAIAPGFYIVNNQRVLVY